MGPLNFHETQRQNQAIQEQNRALLELQRRGQVTERFTRAIDQLGQPGREKLDVRIGGVYGLEQMARDSAELHWPIMEVLAAYLREHARAGPDVEPAADTQKPLPADQQAIEVGFKIDHPRRCPPVFSPGSRRCQWHRAGLRPLARL